MCSLGALGVALHASLLVLLLAQTVPKPGDGGSTRPLHRLSVADRSADFHLPPTYMMHLYMNFRTNLTGPVDVIEQEASRQADTVKSISATALIYRHMHWVVTFDFHTLLADKQIQAAELRIRTPQIPTASNLTVEVYHQRDQDLQLVGQLDESSLVTSSQSWKVFNMTSPLFSWLRQNPTIRHKRVSRKRKAMKKKRGLPLPDRPVFVASPRKEINTTNQALLVVFSHTGSDEDSKAKASLLHTAEHSKFLSPADIKKARGLKRQRNRRGPREHTVRSLPVTERGKEKSSCRRVDLQVDFRQIGWGHWIIFPKRYNAYRCEGSCPGPLGEDVNPTNHAYMQSLLRHYHPDRVASPCCAPTKMSPLSMLYYENGQMLLRHHEDMIVDECGCQ